MDDAIKAEWYDIAASDRPGFLAWLHGEHLPKLQATPGILWVGHYAIAKKGPIKPDPDGLPRMQTDDPTVSKGCEYVLLAGAASADVFFDPHRNPSADADSAAWLAKRREHRAAIFIVEARVQGPEYRSLLPGTAAPPAMQLGNFNVRRPEDEIDLARYYRQVRYRQIPRTRGCIGMRKLVSVAGWPKHGVLYEFVSMDESEDDFEARFREAGRGEARTIRSLRDYVVHGPDAPHAGRRLWPAVT
jgi:hypothetical protein